LFIVTNEVEATDFEAVRRIDDYVHVSPLKAHNVDAVTLC